MAPEAMATHMSKSLNRNKVEVEDFFAPFSESLVGFADEHGLRVDKYWHGLPSWRFSFRHPQTGNACIEVSKEDQGLRVYSYWWYDDFERGARFGRTFKSEILNLDVKGMSGLLIATLEEILSWPLSSWTEITEGLGDSWRSNFSKEQFAALDDKYPTLKHHAHL